MSKGYCDFCEKNKRREVYSLGTNMNICLPCVKKSNLKVICCHCMDEICYSTSGAGTKEYLRDKSTQFYCPECHKGNHNQECHACGDSVAYCTNPEAMEYSEVYCFDCIKKK